MMMNEKQILASLIFEHIHSPELSEEYLYKIIEIPKNPTLGDLAFPCFTLAKTFKKAPHEIAQNLGEKLKHPIIERVDVVGPYINFHLNRSIIGKEIVCKILEEKDNYGSQSFGNDKTIVLDFSSPNIAKPFSMGHLRSTVIGNALANIANKCGFQTVRINHLGDWGTQFGKLITAYKLWGNEEKVKENPISELFILYKKFHEEAEKNPSLEEEGRKAFKRLEDGNDEELKLWEWFKNVSLLEFKNIYELLGISFDFYTGEAFYNDKMERVIELLKEKHLLEHSEGADVVPLTEFDLPPCLIRKSDGASLYATRDLAAAIYRHETYHFTKALYVVGHEQSIHFQQVFNVLKKLGFQWAEGMTHVPFGLYLQNGKKMSTRKGRVVLLEEVLNEVIKLALQNIQEKNPTLPNKEEVAKQIGVGAIIFHDLKNHRMNNIEFSLEEMLTFEGETGPYIQYTYARACSLLRKGKYDSPSYKSLTDHDSWELIKQLKYFPSKIGEAFHGNDPSIIAKYIVDVAQAFNKYYGKVRILESNEELESRLALVQSVTIVLKEGLRLLGIQAPDQM